MNSSSIERDGIEYYYAHIFSSGEYGSNENNNNKLIRHHIRKGIDIEVITEEEISRIQKW